IPFTREIFIDRTDFEVEPLPGFKRLLLGGEVRLRGSYVIKCEEVLRDEKGSITELICSCDEATLGAKPEGRKVKGVIHWVSVEKALDVEVRLYDRLFSHEKPDAEDGDYKDFINPDSLQVFSESKAEPSLADAQPEDRFQFEREGYFCVDNKDSSANSLVFNLTVRLRDTWAKKNQS
ncbi:MAG: glutamine--tRNA ligase, partial [Pseudomonadales bacterium]